MLSIDRTKSGAAAAELAGFPGVHSAPVALRDGRLNLRILVDRSLVEVFAQGGERTIADQVYPTPGSDGLKVFATGGTATLETLDIRELRTTWGARETSTPGSVGGTVPPTLSLTLGPAATFGPFSPARRATTRRSTTANVISTAGDAALTVADPSTTPRPPRQRRVLPAAAAQGRRLRAPSNRQDLVAAGLQRRAHDPVQPVHRRHRRAAHRHLHQDADVHPVHHESISPRDQRGGGNSPLPRAISGVGSTVRRRGPP